MPTFPRLARHSNRSQNALETPAATIAAAAAAGGGTGGAPSSQPQSQPQTQTQTQIQGQSQNQLDSPAQTNTPQSAVSSNTAFSSSESSFADVRSQQQQQQQQQQQALPPLQVSTQQQQLHQQQPQQLQQHQQQQQPPITPVGGGAHLPPQQQHQIYSGASPETGPTASPTVDTQQQPDWVEAAVLRSQSQRYSTYAAFPPQPHHLQSQGYSVGSASLEDLSSTGAAYNIPTHHQPGAQLLHHQQSQPVQQQQQQQQQQPEKKSRRKLIRGIFSSKTNYDNHYQGQPGPGQGHYQGHQSATSYDNTGGLARRPSKRVSNAPTVNPHLRQSNLPPQAQQVSEWPSAEPNRVDNPHPVAGEGEESQNPSLALSGDSHRDLSSQELQTQAHVHGQTHGQGHAPGNPGTIRQINVNNGSDSSPYDDTAYQQAHHHHQQQQQQQQQQPQQPQQQQPQQANLPHLQQQPGQQHQPQQPSAPPSQPHVQPHYNQQGPSQTHRFDQPPSDQQLSQGHPQQLQQVQQVQQVHQNQQQYPYPGVAGGQPQFSPRTDSRVLPNRLATNNSHHVSSETLPPPPPQQDSPAYDSDFDQDYGAAFPHQIRDVTPTPSQSSVSQTPSAPSQQSTMAPQAGAQPVTRRPQESEKAQPPLGPPPGYRAPPNASPGNLTPLPQGQPGQQPNTMSGSDQGRHSPQPEREGEERQFRDLLTKYKNVKRLYFDGKNQIENLTGQVEQLQNAVANQRMSQSRTALDDNEYAGRFNRLNGAINNLAFNIRKDWRSVPPWLERFVSTDGLKTGRQEMTAVGRAVISKWLVDEVFDRVFHPGLEPLFSAQLKEIEMNIRDNAYTMNSQEEFNALTTKIVHWRMATLDGLNKLLQSPTAAENRQNLMDKATTNLTAHLYQYLNNPPPPGVDSSTSMIVELAVGISANMPMESRDVVITYPLPGDIVQPSHMEVEKGELPAPEGFEADSDSEDDTDKEKKNAMPKEPSRVRFAGFVALEVRGRQVLMKAPVWCL